jgi:hypothetical protein
MSDCYLTLVGREPGYLTEAFCCFLFPVAPGHELRYPTSWYTGSLAFSSSLMSLYEQKIVFFLVDL